MKSGYTVIVAVSFLIMSCGSKENGSWSDSGIPGTYVKEYSFKVTNTGTGEEIGMSTVRDSIFIKPKENGYEVSNNKWRMNDYDREGWQSMQHSEDHPLRTYQATFDPSDNSLNAQFMVPLYVDQKGGKLLKGKKGNNAYTKLQ